MLNKIYQPFLTISTRPIDSVLLFLPTIQNNVQSVDRMNQFQAERRRLFQGESIDCFEFQHCFYFQNILLEFVNSRFFRQIVMHTQTFFNYDGFAIIVPLFLSKIKKTSEYTLNDRFIMFQVKFKIPSPTNKNRALFLANNMDFISNQSST